MPKCRQCNAGFEVREADSQFYVKFDFPEPALCPLCRYQRRLAWRNELTLYRRKCDKTGKNTFSIYPADAPFPVYSPEVWFGDSWDSTDYGQDFDFSHPFFEQFYELQGKVPRVSNILHQTVNCDYCNVIGDCKNCYLIFGSIRCEDCMYGNPFDCKSCVDSLINRKSEWCYECIDCEQLYECFYCQNCVNCQFLQFCFDLEGCKNCFLCVGLRRKEFYILNKPYNKADYQKRVQELKKKPARELMLELTQLKNKTPIKFMTGVNNENVTGDHVTGCKNCHDLFFSTQCEEVNHSTQMTESHHCLDCDCGEKVDHVYESCGLHELSNVFFCHWCWSVYNLYYCSTCTANTKNCFGCISLRHREYCILNKQYSKEEYETLVPKIIKHMKKTGEWGESFPIQYSPFAYNETVACQYFPLSKAEVLGKGLRWRDWEKTVTDGIKIIPASKLPDSIDQIPDDILNWAIQCEVTGRPFRIVPKELEFYRKFRLSIPHFHPDERHKRRVAMRNLRVLYDRQCAKCGTAISTSYSPERPEIVYCEKCYLAEVY